MALRIDGKGAAGRPELRLRTYLAPGLPLGFFEAVAAILARRLDARVALSSVTATSGPMPGAPDPFGTGEIDLAFLCTPTFLWLCERAPSTVELVPVAPVFADERNGGRPLFFSEVVVRRDHPARSFRDLDGGTWAFNDSCSQSGYLNVLARLAELGRNGDFFRQATQSGSHRDSLALVAEGRVDAAAIDSNALHHLRAEFEERTRVLESLGPYPAQPLAVRSALDPSVKRRIAEVLLDLSAAERAELSAHGVTTFAPVVLDDYIAQRATLALWRPPKRKDCP